MRMNTNYTNTTNETNNCRKNAFSDLYHLSTFVSFACICILASRIQSKNIFAV